MTGKEDSEMFTIEDAENDGKIKREVGPTMTQVASREYGELYEMFVQVCEDKGMEPKVVLADGVLRAIKNQEFSERVASLEIDMSSVKQGDMRIEDAKLLKQFSKELGLDDEGDDDHWLEDTVKERIQSKTQSPMSQIRQRRQGAANGQLDNDVKQTIDQLSEQVRQLSEKVDDDGAERSNSGGKQDLDDVFGGKNSDGNGSEEKDESDGESDVTVDAEVDMPGDDGDEDENGDSSGGMFDDVSGDVEVGMNDDDNESTEDIEDGNEIVSSEDGEEDE